MTLWQTIAVAILLTFPVGFVAGAWWRSLFDEGRNSNPCDGIFDHKWLSLSCVANGCRSLNTRVLLGAVDEMQPPEGFDAHTPSYNAGFARARKTASDLVRATLDPAVAQVEPPCVQEDHQ